MRRITTAISAAALSLGMALGMNLGVTQAATPGYDSAYQFESAFLTLKSGDSGTFSVFLRIPVRRAGSRARALR